jgi:hypothetical protein
MGYMHSQCEGCGKDCFTCKPYIEALSDANREVEMFEEQLRFQAVQQQALECRNCGTPIDGTSAIKVYCKECSDFCIRYGTNP